MYYLNLMMVAKFYVWQTQVNPSILFTLIVTSMTVDESRYIVPLRA
jgi:hypothetical protein